MTTNKCIIITRGDLLLGKHKEPSVYRRGNTITETTEGTARVVSKNLAIYHAQTYRIYSDSLWHVIHIPTGYVIAVVTYDYIADVKNTFESIEWSIEGDTFTAQNNTFEWQFTSLIQYTVEGTKACEKTLTKS